MVLDARSIDRLAPVHNDLRRVIYRLSQESPITFIVTEGARTVARQAELVRAGASKTMDSRHIPNGEGVVHAVDLAVKVGKEIRWDGGLYIDLAYAVREAARAENVGVVWGGHWEALATTPDIEAAMTAYTQRCRAAGRRPLIDGPHFELPRKAYP